MKFLYKQFKNYINKLRELENKEFEILIKNMPGWYAKYQYGLLSRILRVSALLITASPWYIFIISKYIKFNAINIENYLAIYSVIYVFGIIFLFLHCFLNVIIRIIFFKKIVQNSPIAQCVTTGLRVCRYTAYGVGLLIGVPGIDYAFERNGHIPPLRGYYMKQHIRFFGANSVNCAITEGEQLTKDGILNTLVSNQQEYTRQREILANNEYNAAKME